MKFTFLLRHWLFLGCMVLRTLCCNMEGPCMVRMCQLARALASVHNMILILVSKYIHCPCAACFVGKWIYFPPSFLPDVKWVSTLFNRAEHVSGKPPPKNYTLFLGFNVESASHFERLAHLDGRHIIKKRLMRAFERWSERVYSCCCWFVISETRESIKQGLTHWVVSCLGWYIYHWIANNE